MLQLLKKEWWILGMGVLALMVACAGFSGDVKIKGTLKLWFITVEWDAGFAKVNNDDVPLEVQWFDKDGNPIGDPVEVPSGKSTIPIPPGAAHYTAKQKNDRNTATKFQCGTISSLNFSQAVIMSDSHVNAMEEYLAGIAGQPSPSHSTTICNVQARPVKGAGGLWDLIVTEERRITDVEILFNGKLLAETGDGILSFDPDVGGRWVATIDYSTPHEDGFMGSSGIPMPSANREIPLEGTLKFRWWTDDGDYEIIAFEYGL